ncbi:hypothetical protein ACFLQW_04540 [Candidatus Zixiibacteriota bacterium]
MNRQRANNYRHHTRIGTHLAGQVTVSVLLLVLAVTTGGERVVSSSEKPAASEQKTHTHRLAQVSIAVVPQPVAGGAGISPFVAHAAANADSGYHIPWMSINAGGGVTESPSYLMNSSVAQALIGECTSDNYGANIGYWYGMGGDCDCGAKGDVNGDVSTDPLDVTYLVNYVYLSLDALTERPDCPYPKGDMNCDDSSDPLDVTYLVNYVYLSLDALCDGCAPPAAASYIGPSMIKE